LDQILLTWCYAKFVLYIIISDSISPYMISYPTQHLHFVYTHLLDVLSFCSPTFCTIHHHMFNCRPIEFTFLFIWDFFVTKNFICLSSFHPLCFYFIIYIFIDLSITLQHRSQILKCVLHGYYLFVQTNISCIWAITAKLTFYIFDLVLLGLKSFVYKVHLHNFSFWSTLIRLSSINTTSSTKKMHRGMLFFRRYILDDPW
jgi:hypothetical protein